MNDTAKTKKDGWKVTALLMIVITCWMIIFVFIQTKNHRAEIMAWQDAARPVLQSRGLVAKNPTPEDLEKGLCKKCALTWYERPNIYKYGFHEFGH